MRALQYMVSTALKNNDYELTRVNVDIADYKKGRQDRLAQTSVQWMDKVKASGNPYPLQPMNPADRRVIHKVAEEHGLTTESVGFGRERHVIIKPVADASDYKDEPETKEAADQRRNRPVDRGIHSKKAQESQKSPKQKLKRRI